MRLIEFSREHAQPITLFESLGASSVGIGDGNGEAHVYCLYFEPGGSIGLHPTGFGQLLLVMQGEGWAVGGDGQRVTIAAGRGVYFERGEMHSKGSDTGMTALMVQVGELEPRLPCVAGPVS